MFPSRLAVRAFTRSAASASSRRLARPLQQAARRLPAAIAASYAQEFSTNPSKVILDDMFCRQCEQTADHYACTTQGICGKTSETAACQDALIESIKSVSAWCVQARKEGSVSEQDLEAANIWTLQATFSTLTNVNFSDDRIADYIHQGQAIRAELQKKVLAAPTEFIGQLNLAGKSTAELEDFGHTVSIPKRAAAMGNEDAFSLNEIATYGLKGLCAYAAHCQALGKMDPEVNAAVHEIFTKLASAEPDVDGLLATVLRVGQVNGTVLAMLDSAHADLLGVPEPTPCRMTAVEGKAILVSGHDMVDLYELLKQTEGTGVNVYTHGEMLPAHGYPKLKAFDHLKGNYGTAWQNQKFEFASFPGPIIVTTNCIVEPRRMYKDRLYSMNEVGVDGVQHIPNRDFTGVIEQAQQMKGFVRTIDPPTFHTVGFNHRVVLPLAEQIIDAAKSGTLSRIFLIGGCDGSQWDRSYFTDLAEETPDDSLILTLGCAKNRIIHQEKLMDAKLANGLPRVIDMGQCNDSYSAVVVATELAKALDCSVNDLPLSLCLSHLEQKAAAVLLTLLSMGVKNIRLGPSLPAYVTPNVLSILQSEYNLMGTGDAKKDLAAMMEGN
jgi:hydroxylamine reductase